MRQTILFLSAMALVLGIVFSAAPGYSAVGVDIVEYECLVCDKIFYSFKGDPLDHKDFRDEGRQLSRFTQLGNRGKSLEECKGIKSHVFNKKREGSAKMDFIAKNAHRFVVLKDGGSLNGSLNEWECFICKKPFYSLNDDNLNIKEWDEQQNYLFNLKGQPIYRCKDGYYGHVFMPKKEGSFRSNELATVAHDLYWTK